MNHRQAAAKVAGSVLNEGLDEKMVCLEVVPIPGGGAQNVDRLRAIEALQRTAVPIACRPQHFIVHDRVWLVQRATARYSGEDSGERQGAAPAGGRGKNEALNCAAA